MKETTIEVIYKKSYKIFIPKLKFYPRGVQMPLVDVSGKPLPKNEQKLRVTEKEAHSLVVCQKLFKKIKPIKEEVKQNEGNA